MMKYFADLSEQSSQQVKPSQQQADMSTDAFSSPIEISLTRTVKAISYKVLANLFISEERSDIKNILKQLQKGLKLPPRLMTFLTASGLYKNDEITQLGFDVIKTGTLLSKERGIYEIWYIDDNYFGKMPVAIQRIEESQSHNGKNNRSKQLHNWSQVEKPQPSLRLNTDQATVYLINEAKLRKVSKLAIEVIDRGSASKSTQIKIKLDAPLDKANCHWSINGQITINTRDVQKSKRV
ncbi:hypothetical protein [Psychromonas sp. KJ10-2]|uniref:hypothetical protein n=1 Tax=Psychromonas sp. KJ10-2 TaxID=3391822 RepID=UPI0039B5B8C5